MAHFERFAAPSLPPATAAALPTARGPLSAHLLRHLRRPPHPIPPPPAQDLMAGDPLAGDDLHLALYCCYELHYREMAGVGSDWEWEPSLLAFRGRLEWAFEERLRDESGPPAWLATGSPQEARRAVEQGLEHVVAAGKGPSLSSYMQDRGSLEEMREMAVHRSAYQLKEADPHTWAIPRLWGEAKAAMVEIQWDEYGGGVEEEMHATLFARTMRALGLDDTYGAYLDLIPGVTLATTNLISMFGLHRRLRGALAGHLAVFEMTSVTPMGRYGEALRRRGRGPDARRFYDVHVVADAVHHHVALHRLAGGLAAAEPALAGDILFGARAVMAVEARLARHLMHAWSSGRTSLRAPLGPLPSSEGMAVALPSG